MNTHKNLENSCRDAYVSFPMKNPFSPLRLMDATKEVLNEGGKFTIALCYTSSLFIIMVLLHWISSGTYVMY